VHKKNIDQAVAQNGVADLDCWSRILSLTFDEKAIRSIALPTFKSDRIQIEKQSRISLKRHVRATHALNSFCADPAHHSNPLLFLRIRIPSFEAGPDPAYPSDADTASRNDTYPEHWL
jgi:hypothetical protein